MDPASATVAFVGFSASLTALVGLVMKCSKSLYDLQRKLREAPKGILQLQQDLRNFQALLVETQSRVCVDGGNSVPQGFRELWENISLEMRQDMEDFMATVSRYSAQFGNPLRKKAQMRIRYIFDENAVQEFHRRISRHIGCLSMVQASINELVSQISHHRIRRPRTYER